MKDNNIKNENLEEVRELFDDSDFLAFFIIIANSILAFIFIDEMPYSSFIANIFSMIIISSFGTLIFFPITILEIILLKFSIFIYIEIRYFFIKKKISNKPKI